MAILLSCLGLASACASAAGMSRPAPFPSSTAPPRIEPAPRAPVPASARAVVDAALSLQGTEYRFGGTTPESGFDCSGLVAYVMGLQRVAVPRSVAEQFGAGSKVARDRLQSGDLVFFSTTGPGPTHVGIVTDPERAEFVHAPADGSVVRVERFDSAYWASRWVGARRVF